MVDGTRLAFDTSFLSSRAEKDAELNPLHHHKQETQQNDEQEMKRSPIKAKADESLFPNIQGSNALPEKGTPTNFNHPSTVLTKITSKPTLPLPEVVPTSKAASSEPLIRFRQRLAFTPEIPTAAEKKLLGTMGGLMINAFNNLYENRAYSQVDQLKVFEAANESIRVNRAKERELIEEAHKNAQVQSTWSYARDLLEYFSAATGLLGGLAITSAGVATGNPLAVNAGLTATLGGAGTLGAHILRKYNYDNYYTAALALASSFLSGYGMFQGSAVIASNLQQILAQTLNIINNIGTTAISIKEQQGKAKEYEISSKLATSQFQRESDRSTIQKQIGGLKFKESADFMNAASKLLAMHDEISRRILQETAV